MAANSYLWIFHLTLTMIRKAPYIYDKKKLPY